VVMSRKSVMTIDALVHVTRHWWARELAKVLEMLEGCSERKIARKEYVDILWLQRGGCRDIAFSYDLKDVLEPFPVSSDSG